MVNSLLDNIYEDLEGKVSRVELDDKAFTIHFQCNAWDGKGIRKFTFRCSAVHFQNITVGPCGWVVEKSQHGILNDYHLPACEVYLSKPSLNPVDDAERICIEIDRYYRSSDPIGEDCIFQGEINYLKNPRTSTAVSMHFRSSPVYGSSVFYGGIRALTNGRGLLSRCNPQLVTMFERVLPDCGLSVIRHERILAPQAKLLIFEEESVICDSYDIEVK